MVVPDRAKEDVAGDLSDDLAASVEQQLALLDNKGEPGSALSGEELRTLCLQKYGVVRGAIAGMSVQRALLSHTSTLLPRRPGL